MLQWISQVDLNALTPEERAHYEKFGMLPKKSLASAMLEKRKEVSWLMFSKYLAASPNLAAVLFSLTLRANAHCRGDSSSTLRIGQRIWLWRRDLLAKSQRNNLFNIYYYPSANELPLPLLLCSSSSSWLASNQQQSKEREKAKQSKNKQNTHTHTL